MSLDTLANVKARLGITTSADDAMLGLLQDSADAAVANYWTRDFPGGSSPENSPGGWDFVPRGNFPGDPVTSVGVAPPSASGRETPTPPPRFFFPWGGGVIRPGGPPFLPATP